MQQKGSGSCRDQAAIPQCQCIVEEDPDQLLDLHSMHLSATRDSCMLLIPESQKRENEMLITHIFCVLLFVGVN
jgi:hypothetical protein